MTTDDLVERGARAARDVYLSRQPKWSGIEGYPLEEFIPEARAAIALALEEAALEIERKCRALPKSDRLRAYDFATVIRALKEPK